jgi:hypothetical protein
MALMGSLDPYQHHHQPQPQPTPQPQPQPQSMPQQSMPHQSPEEEREEHPQVEYKTVRRPRRKFDQEVQVLGDKPLIYPMGNG